MTMPLQHRPRPVQSSQRRQLLLVWLTAALVLGGLVVFAQLRRHPLNDPNLADERPGLLDAHGAPFPAPPLAPSLPTPGERAVIFFTRPERARQLLAVLSRKHSLKKRAQLAVVIAGDAVPSLSGDIPVSSDPAGALAAAYGLPTPRDGGSPVGYAVVDRAGRVRYRTLDTASAEHLDEVETMVRATP